ncbi:MAG: hypothetical protein ACI8RD_010415 [Bacillariaceae sp.]|jgi:hypothetical protein
MIAKNEYIHEQKKMKIDGPLNSVALCDSIN